MSLINTYKEYLVTKLFKESLLEKKILTPDELEEIINNYVKTHKDLSLPKSKYINFSVEKGSSSSSSLLNTIIDTVSQDLAVIIKEIYSLAEKNSLYYYRWLKEIERLNIKSKKLEDRVNSLLLLENDTLGYFASITENFSSFENIDTENTTALLDIETQSITIERGLENSGSLSQINTTTFTSKNASFYPLSKKKNTFYKEIGSSNSIVEIFKPEDTSWIGEISSAIGGEMLSELKINFQSPVDVSRIVLNSKVSSSNEGTIVSLQYSLDGYNWFLIPVSNATQTILNNVSSWSFEKINCQWIKFIFNKTSPDFVRDNKYFYRYGIRSIKFYDSKYFSSRGSEFYSSSLSAINNIDEIIPFGKVSLFACDSIPNKTSINYYVSASKDNSTWTDWKEISNTTSKSIYPKIVTFSGLNNKSNLEEDTSLLNSLYDSDSLVSVFDNSNVSQYNFKDSFYAAINTRIPFTSLNEIDLISNSVQVWRNVYRSDSLTVRGVPIGWSFNGQIYTCYFEVFSPAGLVLDFGETKCQVDGQTKTGRITIPQGIHKFQTDSQNWFDLSDEITSTTLVSDLTLAAIDPLYPYNHKLLINGIDYPVGFEGEKIYSGADVSAEFYCTRNSLFDLENKDLSYGSFAIKDISTESSFSLGVIVKFDSSITDYTNESFLVKWKEGESSLYKYIKTKIILDTSNNLVSPSVSFYRLKLGL